MTFIGDEYMDLGNTRYVMLQADDQVFGEGGCELIVRVAEKTVIKSKTYCANKSTY